MEMSVLEDWKRDKAQVFAWLWQVSFLFFPILSD